jgi:hypothetical protein
MTEPKKKRKTAAMYRENWLDRKWRPAMGWMYLVVCITDFIIFPILHSIFQAHYGTPTLGWDPLTLKGGGMFHVAMGAVLGVAAWSRGQERITRYQHGYTDPYVDPLDPNCYGHEDQYDSYTEEARPLEPVADTHTETGFYRYRR